MIVLDVLMFLEPLGLLKQRLKRELVAAGHPKVCAWHARACTPCTCARVHPLMCMACPWRVDARRYGAKHIHDMEGSPNAAALNSAFMQASHWFEPDGSERRQRPYSEEELAYKAETCEAGIKADVFQYPGNQVARSVLLQAGTGDPRLCAQHCARPRSWRRPSPPTTPSLTRRTTC